MNRIIGTYTQSKKGPLLIVFGGVHGNEPAGVEALKQIFHLLSIEPIGNPGFEFKGSIIGLVGNKQAFEQSKRFIDKDLNRAWTKNSVDRILQTKVSMLQSEELEISELISLITNILQTEKPETLAFLDLHTTSAGGGVFCIPGDHHQSLQLASQLNVPVIMGLMDGIDGTVLKYALEGHFQPSDYPKQCLGVAFEGGQHLDPASISRSIAAIVNCMRAIGNIKAEDVDSRHDLVLNEYSKNLPKITKLLHVHHINPNDDFVMRPGYHNFQAIQRNEHLADDTHGPILSPMDGMILMPLYQTKGSDGFFIVV
jgi:succinylglutamate desuccinylase